MHDDDIITIQLDGTLFPSPQTITGMMVDIRTITATRKEIMEAGIKAIQEQHARIPHITTPAMNKERENHGRRWRDGQLANGSDIPGPDQDLRITPPQKKEGNGMRVVSQATKPAWPDPKSMNFTPDRRDPYSTLSQDQYDRRKKLDG
jgi:hypothetical protein